MQEINLAFTEIERIISDIGPGPKNQNDYDNSSESESEFATKKGSNARNQKKNASYEKWVGLVERTKLHKELILCQTTRVLPSKKAFRVMDVQRRPRREQATEPTNSSGDAGFENSANP